MHAVESVRCAAEDGAVDLIQFHLGGIQRSLGGEPSELFGRFQGPPHELGHARSNNRNWSRNHSRHSTPTITTAPLVVGTPRQDCANPTFALGSCRGPASPRS